ncbi:MAG: four helix bundle protein [Verrucomicrobia bacterium]|nr:four helix bundle protein [Verrucomicrobiota bacterium]MBV9275843.1 four helix bundle protein [Verrucomicrobiota bacterium]
MSDLRQRTKRFALRIFDLIDSIPQTAKGRVVQTQLAKAGSSVATNYRAAQRSRSVADFVAKLSIALEELDECSFWLEFLPETRLIPVGSIDAFLKEADELAAIIAASRRTAGGNTKKRLG